MTNNYFENKKDKIHISNLKIYLNRMQKSVMDKMFFIDKVFEPFEIIVDFGCANGELFKAIQALFDDEYKYYGYDISGEMIRAAKDNVPQATFVSDWDSLRIDPSKSLLNISSTIHEVYSYCNQPDIECFWRRVFNSGFKYVTIRDMMVSDSTSTAANTEDLKKLYANVRYSKHLKDYESVWGKVKSEKELVHKQKSNFIH